MGANVFRRFLVPSDGSAAAESAIAPALALVHRTHAMLDLVMVRAFPIRPGGFAPQSEGEGYDDEDSGAYLADLSARILASDGIRPRFTLLTGDPALSIPAYVQVHGVDLVAMGLRGSSWRGETVPDRLDAIGSTAERIATSLHVPILFVPPDARTLSLDRIVFAMDGSADAAHALAAAGVLFFQTSHATLLRVMPVTEAPTGSDEESGNGSAIEELAQLAQEVRGAWRTVATRIVQGSHPTHETLRVAGEAQAGALIVSGATVPTADGRALLAPFTLEILRHANLPVLVFPLRHQNSAWAGGGSSPVFHPPSRPD
jgi:nucleotide-binding universal stress UspA family protein